MVGNIVKILPLWYKRVSSQETEEINTPRFFFFFLFSNLKVQFWRPLLIKCMLLKTKRISLQITLRNLNVLIAVQYFISESLFSHSVCDWEEKWQLLQVSEETSINRQHTSVQLLVADILHPCLLSLKTERKQRNRGESLFDCRQAPEAATEHCLANKNKLIQKVLTELRAARFMGEKTSATMLMNHFPFC